VRATIAPDLEVCGRVRKQTDLAEVAAFQTQKWCRGVANMSDGVVVGSAILKAMDRNLAMSHYHRAASISHS
jgi:tryptophan synthase alpha subunit